MSNAPLRLVAVDMDGTFLDDTKAYDRPRFARLLARLQQRGVVFVVASGNQYYQLLSFFTDHREVYFAAENGALIAGPAGVLRVSSFAPDVAQRTTELMSEHLLTRMAVCGRRSAYVHTSADPGFVGLARHHYHRLETVADFSELDDEILKFTAVPGDSRDDSLKFLLAHLDPQVAATGSGWEWIDLIPAGVNKGAALAWLGERLGIGPESMVAFGDSGNDVEMLRYVGLGVAMENAAPAVREVADAFAGSNNDAGVLDYLEALFD